MTTFKVSKISGAPRFESLPVATITNYPMEKRDYKPYVQCVLCVGADALILRLWAFEVSPMPQSTLRAVLHIFRDKPGVALCVDLLGDGSVRALLTDNGAEIAGSAFAVAVKPFGGEDLQGVYWGGTVELPLELLQAAGGALLLEAGCDFQGNFYKICETEPFVHYGCFYPVGPTGVFGGSDSVGMFSVVGY